MPLRLTCWTAEPEITRLKAHCKLDSDPKGYFIRVARHGLPTVVRLYVSAARLDGLREASCTTLRT